MDWSQATFILALAVALGCGRPSLMVCTGMTLDLVATMLFHDDPISVAVADLVAAAILIGEGKRANLAALLFVLMQPVYVVGNYLRLNPATIYALIDMLAYFQLCLIGKWDVGIGRVYRFANRRHQRPNPSSPAWDHISLN